MQDKKQIIKIVVMVLIVAILILGINFPKFKTQSLDEIKENIKKTESIYVCREDAGLTVPCEKDARENIIEDKEKINPIIENIQNINEQKGEVSIAYGDHYTLYFMDKDKKVIVSAEWSGNITFRTWKKEYIMNSSEVDKLNLKELLGTKI